VLDTIIYDTKLVSWGLGTPTGKHESRCREEISHAAQAIIARAPRGRLAAHTPRDGAWVAARHIWTISAVWDDAGLHVNMRSTRTIADEG